MEPQTQQALARLNRAFYDAEAQSFSETRGQPWPGWEHVHRLAEAQFQGRERVRVLDAGCGNGRFLRFLHARAVEVDYTGCDGSQALLDLARDDHPESAEVRFALCDLAGGDPAATLPKGPFDLVVAFAVLHHVPGFEARRALVEALASRLAPGGLLALTFWRFAASPRFRKRILPWDEYNASASRPIDVESLEPGDHLLRWQHGDGPPRYCHFADDAELDALLKELPLVELARFDDDGKSRDLNRYVVLARPEE